MIHKRTWTGSGSATITDMSNAHKRGKVCKVIRFAGWLPYGAELQHVADFTREIVRWADGLDESADFEQVADELEQRARAFCKTAGITSITVRRENIRAVDAPRSPLIAGVPGKWSAKADESGISVDDDADQNNLPCCITHHGQRDSAAYVLAAKVWDKVKAAATFSQACDILTAAGCRLHYYCRMD